MNIPPTSISINSYAGMSCLDIGVIVSPSDVLSG